MEIDIRTIVIILGVTHLVQVLAFIHQFRVNKAYRGIGWWLLWSAAEAIGFGFMLLRNIPSLLPVVIIFQNLFIVAGTVFLYTGVRRFFNRTVNLKLLIPVVSVFVAGLFYFLFINNDIQIRSGLIYITLAIISFFTAHSLLVNKTRNIAASANFNAAVFLVHGSIFVYHTVTIFNGTPMGSFFTPNLFNSLPLFDVLIVSLLWTFGLIIMLNQRLNAEMSEAKADLQLIFNTSPDAALITRLEDGLIVDVNEGYTDITGYTREDMSGKSVPEVNIWKSIGDRQKLVDLLKDQGHCENFEAYFLRKDGVEIIGLMSAKIIYLQGVPNIFSITRDITERVKLESEALSLLEISRRSQEALLSILEDQKQAQESLRESEEKFRMVFDNVFDGISIYEEDADPFKRKLIECNERYAEMAGRSREELLQLGSTQLITITLDDDANAGRLKSLINITEYSGSFSWIRPDGKDNIIEYVAVPITWRGKAQSISIDRDITKSKRAEEELRANEEKFRRVVEHISDAVIMDNTEGKIIFYNERYLKLFGFQPEDLTHISIEDYVAPEWITEIRDRHDQRILGKKVPALFEYEGIRKNGERIWIEVNVVPIKDKTGNIIGTQSALRDITERKRTEEALKESSRMWQSTFDGIKDAIFLMDANGKIFKTNKISQDLFGKKEEEILGRHCFEVVHNSKCHIDSCPLGRMKLSKQRETTHYQVNDKWFEVIVDPILDEGNNLTGAVHIIVDITGRKLAEIKISEQLDELRRWYKATLDRENRVLDLKQEVNDLLTKMGEPVRYRSISSDDIDIG